MRIVNLKLGADPEFTLKDGDIYVSSEGMLRGSKKEPKSIGMGCAVQEDCVAVEFNIPPASSSDEFVTYLKYSLDTLREMIDKNLQFSWIPVAEFRPEFLMSSQAKQSGCSPDANVWGDKCKVPKFSGTRYRPFGGHIHFGYDSPVKETSEDIVKLSDLFINVATLKYEDREAAIIRRRMYGRAGSHRIKDYGVEYRSLSSWWLESEEKMKMIFDLSKSVVDIANEDNKELMTEINNDRDTIIKAINEHDKMSVDYLTNKYSIAV
jgi:hypothetical protein